MFALPRPSVCKPKPQAIGQGIALRAKVDQKGRVIFISVDRNYTVPQTARPPQLVGVGDLCNTKHLC